MKKVSYWLASVASVVAALMASDARAKTTDAEHGHDQKTVRGSGYSADAIIISQAARSQIRALARSVVSPSKTFSKLAQVRKPKGKPKGTTTPPFNEAEPQNPPFSEFDQVEPIDKKKKGLSKPGDDDVKSKYKQHKQRKKKSKPLY